MKVLIAGGRGFMGSALEETLRASGHEVWILTRRKPLRPNEIQWDGCTPNGWGARIREMDAVVNTTGYGLEHWPWTKAQKRRFLESRIIPAGALASAIESSTNRPSVFAQISGINHYGLRGGEMTDEATPPGEDYLAQLTVQWEAATQRVEELGVRRVVARSAVVLDAHRGLFPLMALPVRLFVGGPLGDGKQAVPWIHVADQARALCYLLENENARGVFNLIAPGVTSNAEFMRAIAKALKRPYWLPTPAFILRLVLGGMSALVVDGRYSVPKRLLKIGFRFQFPTIDTALADLFERRT
jgi:uncharacterized protein